MILNLLHIITYYYMLHIITYYILLHIPHFIYTFRLNLIEICVKSFAYIAYVGYELSDHFFWHCGLFCFYWKKHSATSKMITISFISFMRQSRKSLTKIVQIFVQMYKYKYANTNVAYQRMTTVFGIGSIDVNMCVYACIYRYLLIHVELHPGWALHWQLADQFINWWWQKEICYPCTHTFSHFYTYMWKLKETVVYSHAHKCNKSPAEIRESKYDSRSILPLLPGGRHASFIEAVAFSSSDTLTSGLSMILIPGCSSLTIQCRASRKSASHHSK